MFEDKIIKYYKESVPKLTGQNSTFLAIAAHFYTRRELTQEELHLISGYSRGAISIALKKLREMGMVIKEQVPGTHEYKYIMYDFPKAILQFAIGYMKKTKELLKSLEKLREELKLNEKNLKNLKGYNKIMSVVEQFHTQISIYPKIIERLEDELEKFED
ncbi:MAG: hypothetical protein ACFFCS_25765 [Candidatus Hodarchaeota archaeon]